MRRGMLITLACALVVGSAMIVHSLRADEPDPAPPAYNPYPHGILPSNLNSEIARVQREIRFIENEAIGEWHSLPPPQGNPPTFDGNGYEAAEVLGKLMNFDLNISPFKNTACASCHMPYVGFGPPMPSVNLTMIAYPGSSHFRAGKRNPQRYVYSPDFPVLEFNTTQAAFFGGNFWDARATGYLLQSPDAQQAQGPPVDTQEMGFPDTACIVFRLSNAQYRPLFEEVWGAGSFNINWPGNTEEICETPGGAAVFGGSTTPINLSPDDRTKSNNDYDHWAQSVSFLERSPRVSPFSSKFDAFLTPANSPKHYNLTPDELAGYNLFRGKANCNSCHLDGRSTAPSPTAPNSSDTGTAASTRPLFTCFGYANLGLPLNPRDAFFYQNKPDFFGFTPNPYGFGYTRPGTRYLPPKRFRRGPQSELSLDHSRADFRRPDADVNGARCGDNAPAMPYHGSSGPLLPEGVLPQRLHQEPETTGSLLQHARRVQFDVTSGHCPKGTTEKVDCWPMSEVPNNIDMTVGKLGLSDHGGRPNRSLPANSLGRFHDPLSRQGHIHRQLPAGRFCGNPR